MLGQPALALAPSAAVLPPHQNKPIGEANDIDAHYVRLQGTAAEKTTEDLYKVTLKQCEVGAAQGLFPAPELMTEKQFTTAIIDVYYSQYFTIMYKTYESIGLDTKCKLQRNVQKKVQLHTPFGICDINVKNKTADGTMGGCVDVGRETKMVANRGAAKMPPTTPDSDTILNYQCAKFTVKVPALGDTTTCVMKPELPIQPGGLLSDTRGILLSWKDSRVEFNTDVKAVEVIMDTKVSKRVFFPHHIDRDYKISPNSLKPFKNPFADYLRAAVPEANK